MSSVAAKQPKFIVEKDPYNSRLTNSQDVALRYANSIVLYNNQPVFVTEDRSRESEFLVSLYRYVAGPHLRLGTIGRGINDQVSGHSWVDIRSPLINTDASKLGWMTVNLFRNSGSGIVPVCYHLSRTPVRKYKQGLCGSNVHGCHIHSGKQQPTLSGVNVSKEHILQNLSDNTHMTIEEFTKILFGRYMDERLAHCGISIFSLGFSLNNEVALSYKPKFTDDKTKDATWLQNVSREYKDLEFYVWVEDQLIGTYIPHAREINSVGNGLFSVYQNSLIRAKLL